MDYNIIYLCPQRANGNNKQQYYLFYSKNYTTQNQIITILYIYIYSRPFLPKNKNYLLGRNLDSQT